ncbi:MAG: MmgE/PrpD family protein [Leucobacter sp.]
MTALERIAEWVTSNPPITAARRAAATDAFVDTLACMVAGASDVSTLGAIAVASQADPRESAMCVDGAMRAPGSAALINGTAAHALDLDDNFIGAATHASAVLVPALLAAARQAGADGASLLEAYLVGLQVQREIGREVAAKHYTAGWHATSTIGQVGGAAAVAHLLGLDATQTVAAMSVAVSTASGLKRQFGTPVKPVHAGFAARSSVEAALFAQAGVAGRSDILEGERGFAALYGAPHAGWPTAPIDTSAVHAIEQPGLFPKLYPCCGSTHLAIDAVLDLLREHSFAAADVAEIVVTVLRPNAANLPYTHPENPTQARFSMQYALTSALEGGSVTMTDFEPATVRERRTHPLLDRISVRTWSEQAERIMLDQGRTPHRVELTLTDGRKLDRQREVARGAVSEPFAPWEKRRKFTSLSGLSDAHYDAVLRLAESPNIDAIERLLGAAIRLRNGAGE